MKKIFLILVVFINFALANECADYFAPKKFYEAPEALVEMIEEYTNGCLFCKENKAHNESITFKDFSYPKKSGLYKQTFTKNKEVDTVTLSRVEIYRHKDENLAYDLNEEFDNFWMDFNEDGYEMQLTPEQTLFRYNDTYFSMSVFIYGVIGDATPLKGTIINFWFKNFTKEVKTYINCTKEKNDS